MRTVDIFGPYTGPTGYDQVVRGFVDGLAERGVKIRLENYAHWSGFNYFHDEKYKRLEGEHGTSEVMLNFCLPPQAKYIQNECNIIYSMFEGSRVNKLWSDSANSMDAVIVPTESSKQAFVEGGVRESIIKVVNIGVDPSMYNTSVEPMKLIDEEAEFLSRYQIRVMNIQELGPRKNIEGLLRAWMLGTRTEPMRGNSCLILKISAYSQGRYYKLSKIVDEIRKELGMVKSDHAPVFINCRLFKYEELPSYMASATHYISMSFGEGWDLPAMHAAALGKIVIAPLWSGYGEWVTPELIKSLREGKEVKAVASGALSDVYEGATWIEPSVDEAREVISSLPDGMVQDKANASKFSEVVTSKYSWDKVSGDLYKFLDEYVWQHTPGVPRVDLSKEYKDRASDMSIAHWTQNLGKPCGIANYTSTLCTYQSELFPHVYAFGGNARGHDMMCSVNSYAVENIQFEYQFASPVRLAYMLQCLRERGVKSVVTMHTFNPDAHEHNKVVFRYADYVIVHSEYVKRVMKDHWYPVEKVMVFPMPIPSPLSREQRSETPRLEVSVDKPIIAFYGFLYFHKGVENLVRSFAELRSGGTDAFLLMIASKPNNTDDDVAGRVQKIIDESGLVSGKDFVWVSSYVGDEKEVIHTLEQADLIVLPYDHYGGYGASAAVGSCLSAVRPIVVTDVCWFSHIPNKVARRINSKPTFANELRKYLDLAVETNESWSDEIRAYVMKNQASEVAKQHVDFYRNITGLNLR